jgi:2-polyprenyl-6-hydroxyphenyl methylase/3-demethylubiquinone-9 3-methyltransferase
MARAGAAVTGLDLAEEALAAARAHAEAENVAVDYRAQSVESLAEESPGRFDIVTCMEMLEHVPDPAAVIAACAGLCRPGGHVLLSTINRTPKAFFLAIVGAEYLAGLLPRGTHEYAKFIRPSELAAWSRAAGLEVADIRGMWYNPLNSTCRLTGDVSVNYLMHCRKPGA